MSVAWTGGTSAPQTELYGGAPLELNRVYVVSSSGYSTRLMDQYVTVTYSVDGKWVGTQKTVPYNCQLDTSTLTAGNHTLKVVFNAPNGYSQTLNYQLTKAANGSVSFKQA